MLFSLCKVFFLLINNFGKWKNGKKAKRWAPKIHSISNHVRIWASVFFSFSANPNVGMPETQSLSQEFKADDSDSASGPRSSLKWSMGTMPWVGYMRLRKKWFRDFMHPSSIILTSSIYHVWKDVTVSHGQTRPVEVNS